MTDINVWVKCYATLVAILSAAFPDKAPHFFAHLQTIIKASCTFKNAAWAMYDMAYGQVAVNISSLD